MFTRCTASRAFTLVEVLVAVSLALMLLYVMVDLIVPAMRISARGNARVDLDQRAALVLSRVTRDLKQTSRAGITQGKVSDGQYLAIHPLLGALSRSGNTTQAWSDTGSLFTWSSQSGLLNRYTMSWSETLQGPRAVTPEEATKTVQSTSNQPALSVRGVREFQVEVSTASRVDLHLRIEDGGESLQVRRVVHLTNSTV